MTVLIESGYTQHHSSQVTTAVKTGLLNGQDLEQHIWLFTLSAVAGQEMPIT